MIRGPVALGETALLGLCALAIGAPVLVSVLDANSAGWWPVDDHALTGLAAHDVLNGHPPVMGPRTTTAHVSGVETHHPGPMLYYLLALPLAIAGGQPSGLLAGSALVTVALGWLACWVAMRYFGPLPAAAVAAACAGLQWALGPGAAVLPFNPYPPAFATLTWAVLVWSLLRGHREVLPLLVFVSSLMVQAHISYLAFLAPAVAVALLGVLATVVADRVTGAGRRARRLRQRERVLRARERRLERRQRQRDRRRRVRRWRRTLRRGPRAWRVPRLHWSCRLSRRSITRWMPRSPWVRAGLVAGVLWLPPAVELVRFYPHNNLQQVIRYVSADSGVDSALPLHEVFLTGVGVMAPFPGGMVQAQVWQQGEATIAAEPRSAIAVAVGLAMLLGVVALAVAPRRPGRSSRSAASRRSVLAPSANERAAARTGLLMALGAMTLGSTIPPSSAAFAWNYLQLWAVVFFMWAVVGLYLLRRVLQLVPRGRQLVPSIAAAIAVLALAPALMADRTGRWDEGAGVSSVIESVRVSVDRTAADGGGRSRHVIFETHSLGSTYGIAPSVAFGLKGDRPYHLGAIWKLPEDTDFRKSVSAPRDSVRIVIRDGRPEEQHPDWGGPAETMVTFNGMDGGWYTLYVAGPPS